MRTFNLNADLYHQNYFSIECKQNDDIKLHLNILENGVASDLSGATFSFNLVKADNTIVNVTGSNITTTGNTVTIMCPTDCTRAVGTARCESTMIQANKQTTTFDITINVLPSVVQGQQISKNVATIVDEINNVSVSAVKIHTDLKNDIDTAIPLNNELKANIATATPLDNDLKANIATATPLNNDLKNNISAGNTTNTNLVNNNATATNTLNSLITAISNGDVATIKSDITALKNMKIGIQNLFRNSGQFKDTTYWYQSAGGGSGFSYGIEYDSLKGRVLKFIKGSPTGWYVIQHVFRQYSSYVFDTNKQYTLSFEAKMDVNATLYVSLRNGDSTSVMADGGGFNLTTSWQKFSFTFTPKGNFPATMLYITHDNAGNTLWLTNLSLVEGNKGTEWTQSPEEAQNSNNYLVSNTINKMFTGQSTKIVCAGDSVTWGYKSGSGTQVANPYPLQLQTILQDHYKNTNITVINNGYSGIQADDYYNSKIDQVVALNPDLCILMLGINDDVGSSYGSVLSITDYKNYMSLMVEKMIKAGIEVVLMSPNPTRDTANNGFNRLTLFVKALNEVSIKYNVCFVDLHTIIMRLFECKQETLGNWSIDGEHPNDDKYHYIAEALMGYALDYKKKIDYTMINSKNEVVSIPAVYSPYVKTDCTNIYPSSANDLKYNYILKSDSTNGSYVQLDLYVDMPNMDLILSSPKDADGGSMSVYDGSTLLKTVNFYSIESTGKWNVEDTLIENIPVGYHSIKFLTSNLTSKNAYISEFKLRPTKSIKKDILFGSTLGSIEKFKKINDGTIRYTSTINGETGVILSDTVVLELNQGKKIVFEIEGKFASGSGISWFGNKAGNTLNVNSGYMFYMEGTEIDIYRMMANNSYVGGALITGTRTIDYTVIHKIRIEHNISGLIIVFLDGTPILQTTNTENQSGYLGLYTYKPCTIEITRCEYAYV